LKILEELSLSNPSVHEPVLAMTFNNLAALHFYTNEWEKVEKENEAALKIRRRLAAADSATSGDICRLH